MAGVSLQVREVGTARIVKGLLGLQHDLRDASPTWRRVLVQLMRLNRATFASRGQGEWAPLSERTRARKSSGDLRPELGRATDAMYLALTQLGAPGQVRVIKPQELRFGVELEREGGYPYPVGFNARRPLLAKEKEVNAVVARELQRQLGKRYA